MSEAKHRLNEEKLKAIWEFAGDAMVFLDAEGLLDCNDAALRLLGIDSRESAFGLPLHALAPPTQADGRLTPRVFAEGRQKVLESGSERFDWQFLHPGGGTLILDVILHAVHMGGGQVLHGIFRDVTPEREAAQQLEIARRVAESDLRHLSRQDSLTGLPNRSLFAEEGQRRLDAARQRERVCLLSIDIDKFRTVNEALGPAAGEGVLRAVSERLRLRVGSAELLARVGSDEFGVLLVDCDADAAAALADCLIAELAQPLTVGDQRLSITVSIGVACAGASMQDLEDMLQQAGRAMHVARQSGPGGWQMFAETMNLGLRDSWQLENDLRTALERQEFVLHYQPQVDLLTNRIVGVEALARWQHPQLGQVSPARFIPLAEQTGLIEPLGEWVLFEACRQNQLWLEGGLAPVRMSVNVAARQFQSADLPALVGRALGAARLAPERLELELTESTLMDGSDRTFGILSGLRDQGVSLAIDDFGTGYSSLSYLQRFPVDRLKLDQSFVRDIDGDPDNLAIARAIINLGHNLHLMVIAEGVETQAQRDLLRQEQCDQAQGFYFARALPAADMKVLLRHAAQA